MHWPANPPTQPLALTSRPQEAAIWVSGANNQTWGHQRSISLSAELAHRDRQDRQGTAQNNARIEASFADGAATMHTAIENDKCISATQSRAAQINEPPRARKKARRTAQRCTRSRHRQRCGSGRPQVRVMRRRASVRARVRGLQDAVPGVIGCGHDFARDSSAPTTETGAPRWGKWQRTPPARPNSNSV